MQIGTDSFTALLHDLNATVWAAIFSDGDQIGERYLEDGTVAFVDNTPNPFADGVESHGLDADGAKHLWTKSEDMIAAG